MHKGFLMLSGKLLAKCQVLNFTLTRLPECEACICAWHGKHFLIMSMTVSGTAPKLWYCTGDHIFVMFNPCCGNWSLLACHSTSGLLNIVQNKQLPQAPQWYSILYSDRLIMDWVARKVLCPWFFLESKRFTCFTSTPHFIESNKQLFNDNKK